MFLTVYRCIAVLIFFVSFNHFRITKNIFALFFRLENYLLYRPSIATEVVDTVRITDTSFNFLLNKVLSIAIFCCLNIIEALCLSDSPFLLHLPKIFSRFFFNCRNSIIDDAEVYFLYFPLPCCTVSGFFRLNFILVQVINSSDLFSTLFTSLISFVRKLISSKNAFSCCFITVTFTSVNFISFPAQVRLHFRNVTPNGDSQF